MKIDLHTHTSERSACSIASLEEQLASAKSVGLDGIAVTDHDRFIPTREFIKIREAHAPFKIFTGIEVTVSENEHILVIGLHDNALQKRGWNYSQLHQYVRRFNAFLAIAHPGRFQKFNLDIDRYPPDAIELRSGNIHAPMIPPIAQLIDRVHVLPIYTSDAHSTNMIGKFYIETEHDIKDDAELVRTLKAGEFTCCEAHPL